jgi:hypothetical protein
MARQSSQWMRALREISRPFKLGKDHTKRMTESRRYRYGGYAYYPALRCTVYTHTSSWNVETEEYEYPPKEGAAEALKVQKELFIAWNLFGEEFLDSATVDNHQRPDPARGDNLSTWRYQLTQVIINCPTYCSAVMPEWMTNDVTGLAVDMYQSMLIGKRPQDLHDIFRDALTDADAPEMAMLDRDDLWPTAAVVAVCRSDS